ncbi:MAG: glycosyltransferase family 2 protein [Candidatus Levybacteria bacterium]|nr:glycosyltransferase family 2 protein [Candidatus Levybacteria bacterium]
MDLSIIIVNYNTKDFLKKCIKSIVDNVSKKISYEIIVIDNASADRIQNSEFSFILQNQNLQLIFNKKNLGFSKANNIGIRKAQGRYILFLNPDTVMQKNVIEKMVEFMDNHKDAGAATCKLIMPNGQIDDACHRGFPTPWNAFCHFSGISRLFTKSKLFSGYNLGFKDLNKIHEIDALAGAFMLVRRVAGENVGWWDEDYFFYGEDIDFCYMLKQNNWKVYFVPTVSILHYKGVSGGIKNISKKISTADKETKKRVTHARFNAMRIFYKKHYENKYPKLLTWLVYKAISLKEILAFF